MRYKTLSLEIKDRIAAIRFNTGGACYAHPDRTANELREACGVIRPDPGIRVVTLYLAQKEPPFEADSSHGEDPPGLGGENPMSWAEPVAHIEVPVIISLEGHVVGRALALALACDIRVASRDSIFRPAGIHAGTISWDGTTQRLPRLIGKSRALELLLTGDAMDGEAALGAGLVNRLSDNAAGWAGGMAAKMAQKAPVALRYTKEAVCNGMEMPMDQAMHLEADLYFLLHTSQDRTEGITAFREKRKPEFRGR